MRIVFLQDDFPPLALGGAAYSTYELAMAMSGRGHEVFVITTCRNEAETGETYYKGLKVFRIMSRYPERLRSYFSLRNPRVIGRVDEILGLLKPDTVHINNIHEHLSYHCVKLAKKHAKRVVFTARDAMTVHYGKLQTSRYLKTRDCLVTWFDQLKQARLRFNPFRDLFIKHYLSFADHIVAVSAALRDALVQNGIEGVSVIRTGVNVGDWNVNPEETKVFRDRYGLAGKKVVLFGGRLSEGKGGGQALRAFARVSKECPNAVLLVAGTKDTYAGKLSTLASELGIEDKVQTTGWIERDSMRIAYGVADMVLVPSLYLDPFPRIVIEAMASGKPVIGSRYGGSPEIIADGRTGFIVDPFDETLLADRIALLLRSPAMVEKFGRKGRERVEKDFNIEDTIKAYIVAYEPERKPG